MRTKRYWNAITNESFIQWINEQNVTWAVVTFTCRKKPIKFKNSDIQKINDVLISQDSVSKTCSKKDMKTGFSQTINQLNYKHVKGSQRKKGIKNMCVPFEGGDISNGIWNHIHALIQLPSSTSIDELSEYLNKIYKSKMEALLHDAKGSIIQAEVWCEQYVEDDGKFIRYCLRKEEDSLIVNFDKVILSELVLSPTKF
jgi:hypothetical protein